MYIVQSLKQYSVCLSFGLQGLRKAHTSSLPHLESVSRACLKPILVSKQRLRLRGQDLGGKKHVSVVVREPHYKRLASTDRDGTLGRLRKNDCQELEARLVYRVGLFSFFFKKTKADTHNRCPQFSLALRVTPRFPEVLGPSQRTRACVDQSSMT